MAQLKTKIPWQSVSNAIKLPPLQYAIKEKNESAIDYLLEKDVKLVTNDEYGLTILEDENELPLQLFFKKVPSGSQNPLYTGFEGPNSKWIGSKLPHLPNPELLEGKDIEMLSDESIQEKNCLGLMNLVECHCIQPLYVAFRQKLISNGMTLTNGMHISEYIAQNGTEELTMYYASSNPDYLFQTKERRSSMIESSVDNTNEKVLKRLLEQLPKVEKQSLPIAGEIPTQDEQVSTCLYKSLERCIESDVLGALQIILNHDLKECTNIRFNYLYREENTLLQLISLKNRNTIFLETILKKLILIKDDNLTHIDKIRLIDWKNEKNDSVLHQIVSDEQNELLESLLQFDPDIQLVDGKGNTALHIAVENKNNSLVEILVNSIKDVKVRSDFLEAQNTLGLTALHVAIDRESKDIAKTLLETEADFFTKDKVDEFTILHHSIKLGSEKARKDLMEFVLDYEKQHFPNGEILYTSDKEGNMPIHLAIKLHYRDAVRILLERDSKVQLYLRNQDGYTPLHYATLFDTVETIDILELLFSTERELKLPAKTILNERCSKGRTPLHLAISKGSHTVAVKILDCARTIDPSLDHLLCIDYDLCSILHHAVMANNIKIPECVMRELTTEPLEKDGLNRFGQLLLNLQDKSERTALIIAIEKENSTIFCELLNFFPLLYCRDKEIQRTVLHHAIEIHSKNTEFFDQIRKRLKTEEFQSLIRIMDKNHHTAFHLAIKIGDEQLVELLVEEGTKIAVEKEFGSDVYTVGADSGEGLDVKFGRKGHETDLQLYVYLIAFKVGSKYIISTLPKLDDTKLMDAGDFGNDVQFHNVFPEDHEALVKSVVASKCPELIKKMLSEKMISIENAPETNLMYLAAQYGTKAVMQYLCEEEQPDFDYESQDTSGNTLVHCVAKNSIANIKTLKYILKKTENFERGKKEKSTRKIINFTNNRNQSALQISINLRKFEFFIALINRGANVTEQNHQGNSILHVLILEDPKPFESIKLVIEAILNNENLKKKLSTLLILKNHDGLTVLQIAIMNCHNEIVKFLIKNKASVRDIQSINRNTVVHLLTVNDWDESDMESISIVLNAVRQQDEDKTIRRVRNIDLETPLHISVRDKGKNFLTKSLLDVGVPLEIYNRERNTVLHIAALNEDSDTLEIIMQHLIRRAKTHQLADRRVEYMRELVRENKNKLMPISIPRKKVNLKKMLRAWNQYHEVNMGDGRRGLLIHFAVYNQKSELVDGILESIKEIEERHEIDYQNLLSSRDTDDMTPLHVAAEVGDEQVADLLIRFGADIQLNSARGTPVEIAMQKDHIHLALRLVKRGAKINKYLDLLTYDKISDRDIQEIFNKKKINVERRISSADCTVIHYAAKQSSVSRIALLLRNDIALTTSDRDGKRVLHYAVQYRDNYEVLNFFLDEAYKRDERKQRELERKSEEEQLEYEELYLSYMEALFYHDLDGITPVMLAASLDKVQLFRLLTTPKYEYILDTFDTCDPNENNVMHYLAKCKSIKVARYIVPRLYKYDVHLFTSIMNDRNTRGDSPIDLARKRGLQEMVDLFIEHCDCEYFESCPDVVHRMVKGKDFHNFEKVLEKTVNQDTQNVQIATKLMDSNEEGAYPNFAFFNFHLDPLWHKLYKSNEIKYKYHPIVKFLIDEKLTVYKWWFLKLFLLYLFLFYIPFATALSLASSRCDYELFLYNTHEDRLRFLLEMYILLFTWVYMMNEVFEIFGKYRYLETLDETTNDLRYQRRHHVQYYGDEESDKFTRWIQNKVKRIFFEIPTILKERLYRLERSDHFRFFPRFMFRAIYRHFRDTYNIIDFAGVLLLLSLFFFRTLLYFSKSDGVIGIHWAIQALTFSVFTLKFFKYTKMIPSLGIYIETLSNVLSRDVPRFTLVILIVLIGYTGSIQQVARTNKLSQCDKGSCSFSDWFNDDSIPFSPITTPLISGILFILDGGPSNYEGSLRNVSFLFSVVYLIFAFSIIVILLNVFIAQLSQTYSDINSKKDLLDFKADLALEYETQSNILFAFRSPITRALKRIMVQSIIIPVDVWKEYLDSYLKRVSESTLGGECKNNSETKQDIVQEDIKQYVHDLENKFDFFEEKLLKKLPFQHVETNSSADKKNGDGQNDDQKDLKKKMQQMEQQLTDISDKQTKFFAKFEKLHVVEKPEAPQPNT